MLVLLLGLCGLVALFAARAWFSPSIQIFQDALKLQGSNTATFDKADPNQNLVMLIKATFTPGLSLTIGELTEADFPGYAAIECLEGPVALATDPATGEVLLTIVPSAGGFLWVTNDAPDPTQTIYGYAFVNAGKTQLYGAQLISPPVVLNSEGLEISIPYPTLRLAQGALS
jgi:hypothetical protein